MMEAGTLVKMKMKIKVGDLVRSWNTNPHIPTKRGIVISTGTHERLLCCDGGDVKVQWSCGSVEDTNIYFLNIISEVNDESR